jgi:ATP-binding protein involved in chromosome partitioning
MSIDPRTLNEIQQQLSEIIDPVCGESLLNLDAVENINAQGEQITMTLSLGYPGQELLDQLAEEIQKRCVGIEGVKEVDISSSWQSPSSMNLEGKNPIPNVSNVIAVASGKGGVGKSTTTVNLALALSALGAKVGILDADIYGPSQPMMLGVTDQRPQVRDEKAMLPIHAHGLQIMSMGFLLSERTPAVWRGPMATGALQQLIFQTDWQDLDYLFVDMPPGTGDIQLTLSQQVPVSGAVIVTTPQDIALLDAKKAIEMFNKVNIPVLGVVENMAVHQCSKCGHEEHIFGEGGGDRIAKDYNVPLLGALPLALSIREQTDGGAPSVIAEPESSITNTYKSTAQHVAARLWLQSLQKSVMPEISITDD